MNPIEVARNLFLLRREHSMTIEDLANAMEVTPELICEWECAKTSPTLEQINRLAKVYGVGVSDIIVAPKQTDLPESEFPAPQPAEEPTEEAATEASEPEAPSPKKRGIKAWEVLVIVLLLLIIFAAAIFLIKPEWFPLKHLFGAWISLGFYKLF